MPTQVQGSCSAIQTEELHNQCLSCLPKVYEAHTTHVLIMNCPELVAGNRDDRVAAKECCNGIQIFKMNCLVSVKLVLIYCGGIYSM